MKFFILKVVTVASLIGSGYASWSYLSSFSESISGDIFAGALVVVMQLVMLTAITMNRSAQSVALGFALSFILLIVSSTSNFAYFNDTFSKDNLRNESISQEHDRSVQSYNSQYNLLKDKIGTLNATADKQRSRNYITAAGRTDAQAAKLIDKLGSLQQPSRIAVDEMELATGHWVLFLFFAIAIDLAGLFCVGYMSRSQHVPEVSATFGERIEETFGHLVGQSSKPEHYKIPRTKSKNKEIV